MPNGSSFVISGLKNRLELNGHTGTISRFDTPSGRYVCALEDGITEIKIRPQNLELLVGRAWRSYDGIFDGESEDEDEYIRDAKRRRLAAVNHGVCLQPRAGPVVRIVATADLHRHHDERYIKDSALSLAEWFESPESPPHLDLALFAGDLGLEMKTESTSPSHTCTDRETLESWRALLARILAAKPSVHVVIVGGNHDGLLCSDDKCLACTYRPARDANPAHRSPSEATRANVESMLEGLDSSRVHVLFDESADVRLQSGEIVRVAGSPWTAYETRGKEHRSFSHAWRPKDGFIFGPPESSVRLDCQLWWRDHWEAIGKLLSAECTDGGELIAASVLVTHTPPKGILDIVGGHKDSSTGTGTVHSVRVGDDELRLMLEGLDRRPLLHCFGHVHAKQRRDEPPEGPRLAASKRVPTTLFANVAAERQLPTITGYRMLRKSAAAALDSGKRLALPAPGPARSTAIVPYMPQLNPAEWELAADHGLLMRPPTVLMLPLHGFTCNVDSWSGDGLWERVSDH
jgi:hypothetical protein